MLKLYKSTKYQNDCRLSSPAFMTFSRFFSPLRVIEQWLQKRASFVGSRLGNWRSRTMGSRPSISIRKRRTSSKIFFSKERRRPVSFFPSFLAFLSPSSDGFLGWYHSYTISYFVARKKLEIFFLPNQPWPLSSASLILTLISNTYLIDVKHMIDLIFVRLLRKRRRKSTMFEKAPKMSHSNFQSRHFSSIFVFLTLTCVLYSVTF